MRGVSESRALFMVVVHREAFVDIKEVSDHTAQRPFPPSHTANVESKQFVISRIVNQPRTRSKARIAPLGLRLHNLIFFVPKDPDSLSALPALGLPRSSLSKKTDHKKRIPKRNVLYYMLFSTFTSTAGLPIPRPFSFFFRLKTLLGVGAVIKRSAFYMINLAAGAGNVALNLAVGF